MALSCRTEVAHSHLLRIAGLTKVADCTFFAFPLWKKINFFYFIVKSVCKIVVWTKWLILLMHPTKKGLNMTATFCVKCTILRSGPSLPSRRASSKEHRVLTLLMSTWRIAWTQCLDTNCRPFSTYCLNISIRYAPTGPGSWRDRRKLNEVYREDCSRILSVCRVMHLHYLHNL